MVTSDMSLASMKVMTVSTASSVWVTSADGTAMEMILNYHAGDVEFFSALYTADLTATA